MNIMKSIFLGSALAVAAATGAQAADPILDVKAPREPVYRCDITGFIEIPGSDVCFKVGGYARLVVYSVDSDYTDSGVLPYGIAVGGFPNNTTDGVQMYGQARVNFDARTVTEYGTVRAFIEMQATDSDGNTGGNFGLRHAFVQFGNWTFGKTWSTFLHLASSPDYTDAVTVVGDNFIRRNQIRYTQSFGNGFTMSVALEDQNYNAPTSLNASGLYSPFASAVNDRTDVPDLVAAINYSGGWGEVQLSGALTQNEFSSYPAVSAPFAAFNDDEIGYAAQLGLVINTPFTGEGDAFTLKGIYTDGASQYTSGGGNGIGRQNVVWGDCTPLAASFDDCILDSVQTWSVLGSFTHGWTDTISSTIGASYQNTTADNAALYPFMPASLFAGEYEVDAWEVFANVSWTPVARTTFMIDLHYGELDYNGNLGFVNVSPFPSPIDEDGEAFLAAFQVTRSF